MCRYEATMFIYIPHMNSIQSTMWPGAMVYNHSHYLDMPLNKYVCHIVHICSLLLLSTYRSHFTFQVPHMPITSCAGMRELCPHIYLIWTPWNEQCDQEHWYTCIPHYCHMPLNKCASNITNICPVALLLLSTYRPHITACLHPKSIKCNIY